MANAAHGPGIAESTVKGFTIAHAPSTQHLGSVQEVRVSFEGDKCQWLVNGIVLMSSWFSNVLVGPYFETIGYTSTNMQCEHLDHLVCR
jgi:hypothetical protein